MRKHTIPEMRKICKPLSITVDGKWLDGFIVKATSLDILKAIEPGYELVGIGIGYDYNAKQYSYYAKPVT